MLPDMFGLASSADWSDMMYLIPPLSIVLYRYMCVYIYIYASFMHIHLHTRVCNLCIFLKLFVFNFMSCLCAKQLKHLLTKNCQTTADEPVEGSANRVGISVGQLGGYPFRHHTLL